MKPFSTGALCAILILLFSCVKKEELPLGPLADPCNGLEISAEAEGNEVTATVTGGSEPYLYSISPDTADYNRSSVFIDLPNGNYNVVVKDEYGCKDVTSVRVDDPDQFTDSRDGHTYSTITIGSQTWMAENLNYQGEVNAGTISCYDDKPANCNKYGALYDFEAAKEVCPAGWHLPSDEEWMTLEEELGMPADELDVIGARGEGIGTEMKEGGSSGMDIQLAGRYEGGYGSLDSRGEYWTSSSDGEATSFIRYFAKSQFESPTRVVRASSDNYHQYSVRCLKDD